MIAASVCKTLITVLIATSLFLVLVAHPAGAVKKYKKYILIILTLFSFLSYINFGKFHGQLDNEGGSIHIHDIYHYVLGTKYFAELGQFDLYPATVIALAELTSVKNIENIFFRDVRDYSLKRGYLVLEKADQIKAEFLPARWKNFKADVKAIFQYYDRYEGKLDPTALLVDHGYNPSPVFSLIGYLINNDIEVNENNLLFLSYIDRILLLITIITLCLTFSLEAALLVAIAFFLFPAGWDWIGGSFLRYFWFTSFVFGISALQRKRYIYAGMCFGLSASLTGFPGLLLIGIIFKFLWELIAYLRGQKNIENLLYPLEVGVITLTVIVMLFSIAAYSFRGLHSINDWISNSRHHGYFISDNSLGVVPLIVTKTANTLPMVVKEYTSQVYSEETFGTKDSTIPEIGVYQNLKKRETLSERKTLLIITIILAWTCLFFVCRQLDLWETCIISLIGLFFSPIVVTNYYYCLLSLFVLLGWRAGQNQDNSLHLAIIILIVFSLENILKISNFYPSFHYTLISGLYAALFMFVLYMKLRSYKTTDLFRVNSFL